MISTSGTLSKIRDSLGQERYHVLDLEFAELGDTGVKGVLETLHGGSLPSLDDNVQIDVTMRTQSEWLDLIEPLFKNSGLHHTPLYNSFRVLHLVNNDLTSACLPAISAFLTNNLTLIYLDLGGNRIGSDVKAFQDLARAVGTSSLRVLSMSSNPIMTDSLSAFLDSIPANGTALTHLKLSNVLTDLELGLETPAEEATKAAKAIAGFIADPQRCRNIWYLHLNGNEFGSRGVRAIISALVGSVSSTDNEVRKDPFYEAISEAAQLRRPNRSIKELEIAGNLERGWLPEDPTKEAQRLQDIRKRYASIPLADIEAIVSFLHLRARHRRLRKDTTIDSAAPIEITRHLSESAFSLDDLANDFEEAAELSAGVTSANWQNLTFERLRANAWDARDSYRGARTVLAAARIVGCKAKRQSAKDSQAPVSPAGVATSFPRFLDLPPELRLLILREVDEGSALSTRQFNNVISYACDPSTIGYSTGAFDWADYGRLLDKPESSEDEGASSTLPAQKWSWIECFALRSPPRDWVADERLWEEDDEEAYGELVPIDKMRTAAFHDSTMTNRAAE